MWKEHTGWACKEAIFTVWWGIHSPCWKWYKLRCTTWLHNQDNITCKTKLLGKFDKIWCVLNKLWLKLKDTKPKNNTTTSFWMKILEEYLIEFPNIAELILIVLSISPTTSLLERRYSKLTKKWSLCFCWDHDILYLLCTLQIIDDNELFYEK